MYTDVVYRHDSVMHVAFNCCRSIHSVLAPERDSDTSVPHIRIGVHHREVLHGTSRTSSQAQGAFLSGPVHGSTRHLQVRNASLCICKLNRYRHISVRVGLPIPPTCLKACEFVKSALIMRKPRHEIWRFSEFGVNTLASVILWKLGPRICRQMPAVV